MSVSSNSVRKSVPLVIGLTLGALGAHALGDPKGATAQGQGNSMGPTIQNPEAIQNVSLAGFTAYSAAGNDVFKTGKCLALKNVTNRDASWTTVDVRSLWVSDPYASEVIPGLKIFTSGAFSTSIFGADLQIGIELAKIYDANKDGQITQDEMLGNPNYSGQTQKPSEFVRRAHGDFIRYLGMTANLVAGNTPLCPTEDEYPRITAFINSSPVKLAAGVLSFLGIALITAVHAFVRGKSHILQVAGAHTQDQFTKLMNHSKNFYSRWYYALCLSTRRALDECSKKPEVETPDPRRGASIRRLGLVRLGRASASSFKRAT